MNSKKLIAAVVAACAVLAGGLGVALWPSPAGATGNIRKYSGALVTGYGYSTILDVRIHNPHPTATLKPSVVVRDENGGVILNQEFPVGPHKVVVATPFCQGVCTVEVNMTHPILQPSLHYYSRNTGTHQFLNSGDFSR